MRAVTRLRNGGILLEFVSDAAVAWFAHRETCQIFLKKLHPEAVIKPRGYHVVVQFVPLTLRPNKEVDLREIEEVNGLAKGDIIRARWIKPAARRSPSQTCGHAIFSFTTPQAANNALVRGLYVCHKKVYAEKCKREPLRCLKCHRWGHLAHSCLAPTDTCGTCALHHRTDTCVNQDKPHCVSCGVAGHASWDRSCPVFQQRCRELDDRMEDNSLPYFPTAEAWTQVREPPKTAPQRSQPPPRMPETCRAGRRPVQAQTQGQGPQGPPAVTQENGGWAPVDTNGSFSSLPPPPHMSSMPSVLPTGI